MSFNQRILSSAAKKKSRVVLALDISGPYEGRLARADAVLQATKDRIAAVKVNHHLLLPFGLQGISGVIGVCKHEGLPLIADLKINDIESTNLNLVDSLMTYGFDAVIANPFVGLEEGLAGVIEKAHARQFGVIFLVYMSHKGAGEGYGQSFEGGKPVYRTFAERARDWKADGVVVSAKDGQKIVETREIVGKDCLIFSPGVGAQGGEAKGGASTGADFLIVGRSITESRDPEKALREINGN